jgi:monovalent cation:H+ antiporter, CPA1 family
MEIYNLFTVLIVLSAIFGYINYRYIKLPGTIGIMVMSIVTSLIVVTIGSISPEFTSYFTSTISKVDFGKILMGVMLSFLLFAGSINLDSQSLKLERKPVLVFATFGVLLSTLIVGTLIYYVLQLFSIHISYLHCLLFGSLISPTDPIAVMSILKDAKIPKELRVRINGESLFNDGISIVIFITLFEISNIGTENLSFFNVIILVLREVAGGLVFGAILGYTGFLLLRSIDNYKIEVIITLALVMGGYALSSFLHISGPLAMVVTGLIIGNQGRKLAMSDTTKEYLDKFWEIIDDLLNAVLFVLIGLELLLINIDIPKFELGLIAFLIVVFARYISVGASMIITRFKKTFQKADLLILTWGGLRGGISVALALSLSDLMNRELFLSITYVIVLLSVILQGLTIEKVAIFTLRKKDDNLTA